MDKLLPPKLPRTNSWSHISDDQLSLMRQVFTETDLDGSGRIDGEELKHRLQLLGWDASDDNVTNLIKKMDIDGDGTINFFEFVARAPTEFIVSMPNRHRSHSRGRRTSHDGSDLSRSRKIEESRVRDIAVLFNKNDKSFNAKFRHTYSGGISMPNTPLNEENILINNNNNNESDKISNNNNNGYNKLENKILTKDNSEEIYSNNNDNNNNNNNNNNKNIRRSKSTPNFPQYSKDNEEEYSGDNTDDDNIDYEDEIDNLYTSRSYNNIDKYLNNRNINLIKFNDKAIPKEEKKIDIDTKYSILSANSISDDIITYTNNVENSNSYNNESQCKTIEQNITEDTINSSISKTENQDLKINIPTIQVIGVPNDITITNTITTINDKNKIVNKNNENISYNNDKRNNKINGDEKVIIKQEQQKGEEIDVIHALNQLHNEINSNHMLSNNGENNNNNNNNNNNKHENEVATDNTKKIFNNNINEIKTDKINKNKQNSELKSLKTILDAWYEKREQDKERNNNENNNNNEKTNSIDDNKYNEENEIEEIKRIEDRKELILIGRQIGRLDGLNKFKTITNLDLSNNKIVTIAPWLPVNIRTLNLSSNNIKVMEGFGSLKYLQVLNLNDNEIKVIEGLENNLNITELYMADNYIKRVENLEYQQQLECLDLRNNKLNVIDAIRSLSVNSSLRRLYLSGNKLLEMWHGTVISNLLPQLSQLDGKDISYPLSSNKLKEKLSNNYSNYNKEITLSKEDRIAARDRIYSPKKKIASNSNGNSNSNSNSNNNNNNVTQQTTIISSTALSPQERTEAKNRLLKSKSTPTMKSLKIVKSINTSNSALYGRQSLDSFSKSNSNSNNISPIRKMMIDKDKMDKGNKTEKSTVATMTEETSPRDTTKNNDEESNNSLGYLFARLNKLEDGYTQLLHFMTKRPSNTISNRKQDQEVNINIKVNGSPTTTRLPHRNYYNNDNIKNNINKSVNNRNQKYKVAPIVNKWENAIETPSENHLTSNFIKKNKRIVAELSHFNNLKKRLKIVQKMKRSTNNNNNSNSNNYNNNNTINTSGLSTPTSSHSNTGTSTPQTLYFGDVKLDNKEELSSISKMITSENYDATLFEYQEKIKGIRLAVKYFTEFCQLNIIEKNHLTEFKELLGKNYLLEEPDLEISETVDRLLAEKLKVISEEFQLIQLTFMCLLMIVELEEDQTCIPDAIAFLLESVSSILT